MSVEVINGVTLKGRHSRKASSVRRPNISKDESKSLDRSAVILENSLALNSDYSLAMINLDALVF
jgi:hypothetical protein